MQRGSLERIVEPRDAEVVRDGQSAVTDGIVGTSGRGIVTGEDRGERRPDR